MYKNLNSVALGVSGRQSELIELALTYGFRGMDIDIRDLVKRAEGRGVDHATRFLLSARDNDRLRVGGCDLPVDWEGEESTYKADLAQLPKVVELAASVGAKACLTTVMPGSDSQPYHENFEFHRQRLGEIADVLSGFEMRLGIGFESAPVHRANKQYEFIHQAEPLLTLMKTIGVTNVGIVLDTWHWHVGGGASDQLSELSPDQIISVRIADLPGDADLTLVDEKQRVAPEAGGLVDCAGTLKLLAQIGFEGPVALVPDAASFRSRTRDKIVQRAANVLDELWIAAGLVKTASAASEEDGEAIATEAPAAEAPAAEATSA